MKRIKIVTNVLIFIPILVSLTVILGYAFNKPYLITWTGLPMAINAALCFFIYGNVLLILNNKERF